MPFSTCRSNAGGVLSPGLIIASIWHHTKVLYRGFVGYWGLYLISIQLGHYLNFKHASILEWFWQMSNTQKGGTGTMSQWWAAADIGLLDLALWYLITCSLMLLSSVRFFPGKHCDLMIQRLHTSLICQCFLDGKSALFNNYDFCIEGCSQFTWITPLKESPAAL